MVLMLSQRCELSAGRPRERSGGTACISVPLSPSGHTGRGSPRPLRFLRLRLGLDDKRLIIGRRLALAQRVFAIQLLLKSHGQSRH